MPYSDPDAARVAAAERRARWRERRRQAGETTHPERDRNRARGKPAQPERHAKPWLFIDTEGANDPDGQYGDPGRQWTFLICAADDNGFQDHLYRGRPLSSMEMVRFIMGLPHGKHKLGGYFFQYDLDQIFCDLPELTLRKLYAGSAVLWEKWVIRRFNTQCQIIAPYQQVTQEQLDGDPGLRVKGYTRTIWDVGKFYQAKLTTSLDTWDVATDDEKRFIARMKSDRSDFSLHYWQKHSNDLLEYSLLENRLAARLQDRFDRTCRELGYPLTAWYGAGSMAKTMLRVHKVTDQLDQRRPIPEGMRELLAYTYFGGRFEIQAPGRYRPVHEYDLRSAYPASYRDLPCLIHGQWKRRRKIPADIDPHDLAVVDWQIPYSHVWGPFPFRDHRGTISYPAAGREHPVWGVELEQARSMWTGKQIRVAGLWQYHTACDCKPFDWIDSVYAHRVKLGKDSRGYPLKLGMNAAYGSLASTLGAEHEDGMISGSGMFEPRWASMITAWTRAQLLHALRLAGGPRSEHVIMFATDAIYTTQPVDGLDMTPKLGAWEAHHFPAGGLLIQPGVYHLQGQDIVSKLKGRGISFKDIQDHVDEFYEAWDRDGADGTVTLHLSPRYQGVKLMLHHNNLAGAWRWAELDRTIRFDPSLKRRLARTGRWMPRTAAGYRGREPHPLFYELLTGEPAAIETVSAEQREAELVDDAQPDGAYAM